MWTIEERLSTLLEDGRWKVEFFSGELIQALETKYPLVPLGDLVKVSRATIDPQQDPEKEFNYIGLEHVESNTGDLVRFEPRLGKEIRSRSKVFSEGAILYGRLRPYLNKVFLAEGPIKYGICSGEFFVLVPDESAVRPLLLRFLLASPYVVESIARFQSGAALPRAPIKDMLEIKLPLPPMKIQLKIEAFLRDAELQRREIRQQLEAMPTVTMTAFLQALQSGRLPESS